MRRPPFAASVAAGYYVRARMLPVPRSFLKLRYLGDVTIVLNTRLSDKAMARALRRAIAAPLPMGSRSAVVAG